MCKSGKYGELYEKYAAVADGLSLKYLGYVNVWAYWCFFLYLRRSDFSVVAFGVDKKRRQVPQFILRLQLLLIYYQGISCFLRCLVYYIYLRLIFVLFGEIYATVSFRFVLVGGFIWSIVYVVRLGI